MIADWVRALFFAGAGFAVAIALGLALHARATGKPVCDPKVLVSAVAGFLLAVAPFAVEWFDGTGR